MDLPPTVFTLYIEKCFSAEDERFVDGLCAMSNAKWLAAFVERWKTDPRPWAKAQRGKELWDALKKL